VTKPQAPKRAIGEIWSLYSGNAPVNAEQWMYQGTAKTPYVITRYKVKVKRSMTSDGWACSCPNFTQHVPRTPCKHILNVMLNTGYKQPKTGDLAVSFAGMNDVQIAAFKKWQREQAAAKEVKPTSGDADLAFFQKTGRKFR
jgi:hypothetical protein